MFVMHSGYFISENVALNKTTKQSPICGDGYEGAANVAVDGNTTTEFGDDYYPHPCTCSHGIFFTYWSVDLGRDYSLHDITIYQRSDRKFMSSHTEPFLIYVYFGRQYTAVNTNVLSMLLNK